jgi:large exoprotein involved in heme utilization and adhesion
LTITTGQLQVLDGAEVTVSAPEGQAGDLTVTADSIRLDSQGKLTAVTGVENGGNINLLDLDLLLMRRNSLISAEALGTANGGNITINAKDGFVVAVPSENSDIVANAFKGNGGNINITTQGIYGLEYRPKLTAFSDINASSQFGVNGTVEINTPGIDPNTGLINLPAEPVEPQVASGCTAGASQNQSRFVVTGRGGLPLNPREAFNSDTVRVDWVTLNPSSDNRRSQTVTKPTIPTPAPIVEATGWVINDKGEIILTASPPTATPHSSWQTPTTCGAPK